MRTEIGRRSFAVLASVMLFCAMHASAQGSASLINHKAPEITRNALNGRSVSLKQMRGKVVLLNFWATWCAPCLIEMPKFAAWQRQYAGQGFAVIGISMDDDAAPVRKLTAKLKVDYPIAMGDAALGKAYGGVLGLPETFLIDRNGVVRAQFQGEVDLKKIEASLQTLLNAR